MAYVPVLSLVLRHAYYLDGAPPVALALVDGGAFDRDGGVVKARGARLDLYRPEEITPPARGRVEVRLTDPGLIELTPLPRGGGVPVVSLEAAAGASDAFPDAAALAADLRAPSAGRRPLVDLDIGLPADGAAASLTVTLPSVATLWAYHVIGDATGLSIAESRGAVAFDPAGERRLPDGRAAATWLSDAPIALRARQDFTVTLTCQKAYGPEPLIAALPVPARPTSKPAAGHAGAPLQSDIYVTL